MRKHIGLFVIIAAIALVVCVPKVLDNLVALLLVGRIPFTHYTIPSLAMLAVYAILLAVGVYSMANLAMSVASPIQRDETARKRARQKVLAGTKKQSAVGSSSAPSRAKKRYQIVNEH